jgi:cytochrome P450
VTVDGPDFPISNGTSTQLNVVGTNRKPRYWPHSPSKRTGKSNDLDDFVPESWLSNTTLATSRPEADEKQDDTDGLEEASYDTNTSGSLFKPIINSFISFSEGVRACPGRRFAQVQITAVITAIFQKYSVELDVSDWASDEEVARMGTAEKAVYQKAAIRAESVLRRCEQRTITLQMRPGEEVPVRFVEKGKERFAGLYELG